MSPALYEVGLSGTVAEVLQPVALKVSGSFPAWLKGSLYRNGPGTFEIDTKRKRFEFTHWFDAFTVLHKFDIADGQVQYQNRHLNKDLERFVADRGWLPGSFGQDPCCTIFRKAASLLIRGGPKDAVTGKAANPNVGVTIGKLQGKLVSRTDANMLVEICPDDLKPKPMFRYTDINPEFKGLLSSAHAQYDRSAGATINFTTDFPKGGGLYSVFTIPDDDPTGYLLARIPEDPAYIHSFSITEHYVIFMVWPALLTPLHMLLGKSVHGSMRWDGSRPTKFYVIDRTKGGPGWVATYECPAFYCFHTVNAFERDGDIVLDLCRYDDITIIDDLRLEKMKDPNQAVASAALYRYTLPDIKAAIAAGPASPCPLEQRLVSAEFGYELPRYNPAYQLKPYRFMYALAAKLGAPVLMDAVAKVDVDNGEVVAWQAPNSYPGEPIFVPSPDAAAEDDGVLLTVVLDGNTATSFLLVLDAKDLKEIGRAQMEQLVPFGFHGNFFPPDASNPGSETA